MNKKLIVITTILLLTIGIMIHIQRKEKFIEKEYYEKQIRQTEKIPLYYKMGEEEKIYIKDEDGNFKEVRIDDT